MEIELWKKIDVWFEAHRGQMLKDLIRIVRIPSIAQPEETYPPYGSACRQAMDEMLQIGKEHGFAVENREYYVGTIGLEHKNWENTIGFWNHLDVVPVGNGWSHDPFDPYEKEGFLIARGAQDNKGPAIGMLYLMQCIRELEIPMKHEFCLFVGSDEERGMSDLEYYASRYPFPALSIIADSGFPVCYGEKGIVEGRFVAKQELGSDILELNGGVAGNIIPDRAVAILARSEQLMAALKVRLEETGTDRICISEDGATVTVTAFGTSKHSAFPEGSINAIHVLTSFLKGVSSLSRTDQELFACLADATREYYGEAVKIAFEDEVSGKTTCAGTILGIENRCCCLTLNIRYAITADSKEISHRLRTYAEKNGMLWDQERDSGPNYFPKEHPVVDFLTDLYNEWTGLETKPFVMGGGTYARKIPNAFAYGIGGMPLTEDDCTRMKKLFTPQTGGAHQPDEGLNLRQFFEAIKFYTMAMIKLDRHIA